MFRTLTGVLAWVVALVAATAVGITAVNAIGIGIVGAGQRPLSQSEVDARLAATPPTTRASTPTSTPTSTSAPPESRVVSSQGGTVIARCVPGGVEIVSTTAAQGYRVDGDHEIDDHPSVEFTAGKVKVEVKLRCVDGVPTPEIKVDD